MFGYDKVVIHFGELWLRGKNRNEFIKRLEANVKAVIKSEHYAKLEDRRDRFLVRLDKKSDLAAILRNLGRVPGISWYAPVEISKNGLDEIIKTSGKILDKKDTVRIVAHRSTKATKFNSYQIVSEFIKRSKRLQFKIDKDAEKVLNINVTNDGTYIYTDKRPGAGGLPVGSSGKAIILLSGGIDSPVASFYAMKRGLHPIYLHMHGFNTNDEARGSKIKELTAVLSKYSPKSAIYYMPAYLFQSAILKVPKRYELVLFKRFIFRLAELIAEREGAECIVTGESLGQVASQTLKNMRASEYGSDILILRPLLGLDKPEIIDRAKALGTYDISIRPYRDVCSITARNPTTSANHKIIDRFYASCKLGSVAKRTIAKGAKEELS